MDATAVSAARGMAAAKLRARHVALVALFFGGFQALMPLIGWIVGTRVGPLVRLWDHWIAFALLGAIGSKMLWEAYSEGAGRGAAGDQADKTNAESAGPGAQPTSQGAPSHASAAQGDPARGLRERSDLFGYKVMLLLAIATSIDALAVGITLPMLNAPFVLSLLTIGVTTAVLSALGLFAGRRFGAVLGQRLDVIGGLTLIGLGAKILVEHLVQG